MLRLAVAFVDPAEADRLPTPDVLDHERRHLRLGCRSEDLPPDGFSARAHAPAHDAILRLLPLPPPPRGEAAQRQEPPEPQFLDRLPGLIVARVVAPAAL